eukprot:1187993-Prorocentrum_minimum.AAC.2
MEGKFSPRCKRPLTRQSHDRLRKLRPPTDHHTDPDPASFPERRWGRGCWSSALSGYPLLEGVVKIGLSQWRRSSSMQDVNNT